jgi:hypothetical protein
MDAAVFLVIGGQDRRRRLLALQIKADRPRFSDREIAILHRRDQPGRTERSPVRRRIERNHRLDLVLDILGDSRDNSLSHVNGNRNAVDRDHDFSLRYRHQELAHRMT